MQRNLEETIAAPASARGAARRAIIRLSGPNTLGVLSSLFTPDDGIVLSRVGSARRLPGRIAPSGFGVDLEASVYLWPTARSYTGQTMAEIHLIGSQPVVDACLESLYAAGARPALAGEFTFRAFLAGRIDLIQAEAVLGTIHAEDSTSLQRALNQLAGGLSRRLMDFRDQLLGDLADLEAGLDFVEEDIDFLSRDDLCRRLSDAIDCLNSLVEQSDSRMESTERPHVVLAGPPNAGKSTLFNRLAGRPAAIESPVRGTTRDALTATVNWDGYAIDFFDTAGLDEADGELERSIQKQSQTALARADLLLWCWSLDCAANETMPEQFASSFLRSDTPVIPLVTKADLLADSGQSSLLPPDALRVSARTGQGIERLRQTIVSRLTSGHASAGEMIGSTAARCRESLRQTRDALARALAAARSESGEELIAMDLREGLDHLGEMVGAVYTDDLLDRIFSQFCIGK